MTDLTDDVGSIFPVSLHEYWRFHFHFLHPFSCFFSREEEGIQCLVRAHQSLVDLLAGDRNRRHTSYAQAELILWCLLLLCGMALCQQTANCTFLLPSSPLFTPVMVIFLCLIFPSNSFALPKEAGSLFLAYNSGISLRSISS